MKRTHRHVDANEAQGDEELVELAEGVEELPSPCSRLRQQRELERLRFEEDLELQKTTLRSRQTDARKHDGRAHLHLRLEMLEATPEKRVVDFVSAQVLARQGEIEARGVLETLASMGVEVAVCEGWPEEVRDEDRSKNPYVNNWLYSFHGLECNGPRMMS
jgi:hypothetical protein